MRYKHAPRGKQREVIEESWSRVIAAFLCRPGTGKSKLGIDTAALQYLNAMIEAMIVVAPDGVHSQWMLEAIPTHMTNDVKWIGGHYGSRMGIRAHRALEATLSAKGNSLKILCISYEGLNTPRGKKLALDLAAKYKSLVIADESHRVSNLKTVGYKAVKTLMTYATTKRIATGTLLRQNPFAAFGQFELMGHELLGFGSLTSFRAMYAKILGPENGLVKHIQDKIKKKTGKTFSPQIIDKDAEGKPIYRNLPDLRRRLEKFSYFLTLKDVSGTEPIINVSTRYVTMNDEQARVYRDLVEIGIAELGNDRVLIAEGALALTTRLAQVVGGHAPDEDDPKARALPGTNERLQALLDIAEEIAPDKLLIWAKFKSELRMIADALMTAHGLGSVAEYHGDVSGGANERRANKTRFIEDPACLFFVGQQQSGGTGLDGMQGVASQMLFYSNTHSYLDREQCIARLARTSGADVVNVVDLMCLETVDEDIVKCMQSAQDVHEQVLYNKLKGIA